MARDLADLAIELVGELDGSMWPSERWAADPVAFAFYILGVVLWEFQIELLEAIRDNRHVACKGGRKIGKDFAVAIAALWWFASFQKARVFILAPSYEQLDGILYLEIRTLIEGSGLCVDCRKRDPLAPRPCAHSAILTGDVGLQARTGIRGSGFRRIWGKSASVSGTLRGFSGAKVLNINDEASDIADDIRDAMVGNLAAADCHDVLISNPTRNDGFFYRAFHEEREIYKLVERSSEQNPNIIEGREVFPGLASREWIREREIAWGRESAIWASDVEGKFPTAQQGQLFSLDVVKAASSAERKNTATADGRLQIGIDVAGDGEKGDQTVFFARRDFTVLEVRARRGLTRDATLLELLNILEANRTPEDVGDDNPIVVIDRDGHVGAGRYDTINAYRHRDERTELEFRLIGFQGSAPPKSRMGQRYRMNRDLLFAGLVEWVKSGGYVPEILKLQAELLSLKWREVEGGKSQLIAKRDIKSKLGRSPDHADALALSTWTPAGWTPPATAIETPPAQQRPTEPDRQLDPYGGIDTWRRR